jgi:hypothetical protein
MVGNGTTTTPELGRMLLMAGRASLHGRPDVGDEWAFAE